MSPARSPRGFTLLEVMIGLAILGFALVVLVKSAAGSMRGAMDAQMMGVATDLSRAKMLDVEEMLLKDGFTDTDQSLGECGPPVPKSGRGNVAQDATSTEQDLDDKERAIRERAKTGKSFEDEGWPKLTYTYKVEVVELPSWEDLQEMAQGRGSGAGSGSGSGEEQGGFQNSALGGMLAQLGGGFGASGSQDIDSKQGASFIQGQYQMVQQVLKASIRKVTLCVYYEAAGAPNEMRTVAYFTDPASMDKVLSGLGSQDLDDQPGGATGSGSGSGSGSGKGSGSNTGPRPPRDNRGSGGK